MREWILSTWNNGGKNIKLDQTEFIDMGPPSRDSRFNMEVCTAKIMTNLFDWLAASFIIRSGGVHYPLKIAMLEYVHFVKSNPPLWQGLEHTPFTNAIRFKMVRGHQYI